MHTKSIHRYFQGLLFLIPALLVFGIFQWYPIVQNFLIAFQDYVPGFPGKWIGFDNYATVLGDPRLFTALLNTLWYVALCLLIGYLVPIVVAIALSEIRRGRSFFRLAIYVPNIVPLIAVAIIWTQIYNPQFGLLNGLLGLVGVDPQLWLVDQNQVVFSLAAMSTWQNFGATAVLYMASLTAVNTELYESAEMDGAGFWHKLRFITVPSIADTMKLLLVLQLIATFAVLQEPFVMTSGGPVDSSLSVMLLTYQWAFNNIEFGKSGALGSMVFLTLLALSIFYIAKTGLAKAKGE